MNTKHGRRLVLLNTVLSSGVFLYAINIEHRLTSIESEVSYISKKIPVKSELAQCDTFPQVQNPRTFAPLSKELERLCISGNGALQMPDSLQEIKEPQSNATNPNIRKPRSVS